jgi:hypothetical protein
VPAPTQVLDVALGVAGIARLLAGEDPMLGPGQRDQLR